MEDNLTSNSALVELDSYGISFGHADGELYKRDSGSDGDWIKADKREFIEAMYRSPCIEELVESLYEFFMADEDNLLDKEKEDIQGKNQRPKVFRESNL